MCVCVRACACVCVCLYVSSPKIALLEKMLSTLTHVARFFSINLDKFFVAQLLKSGSHTTFTRCSVADIIQLKIVSIQPPPCITEINNSGDTWTILLSWTAGPS